MGLNVLAVDDSSTVRAVLARTLRLAEIDVSKFGEASTGDEAMRMLREEGYDLIFCDLNMPGMTGFDLIEELERAHLLESVAVVVVSSLGDGEAIENLRAKGIRGYLRKPVRPEDVRRIVGRVMGAGHGPV